MKWLALLAGGGIGASLRYAISIWVDQRLLASFPWGTFLVNVIGSFLVGLLVSGFDRRGVASPALRLFLITGLLGAFTTFSTFSLETLRLIDAGRFYIAAANVAGSVLVCLLAAIAGIALAKSFS